MYLYENHTGAGANGMFKYWDYDYSYGNGGNVNYTDTTHPQAGHTYDIHIPQGKAWQPATDNNLPFNVGPFGYDISKYTYITFDIWTAFPNNDYDIRWEYNGSASSGQIDQVAPGYVPNILHVPGVVSQLNGNGWTTVKIPLAFFGHLGVHAAYKFYIRDNTPATQEFFLDNVGFVAGNLSWIYDGGAVNGWNALGLSWSLDSSEPLNGWTDETPSGSSADYYFNPISGNLPLQGKSGLNDLLTPGYGTIKSTNVIQLKTTVANGMWKVSNGAGFALGAYTNLTFGLLPTNSNHSYMVQFYSTNGDPVGDAVNPADYTNNDFGTANYWTAYSIPLADFGNLPETVGGMSIQDISGLSNNTIYITAPGFYK